MQGGRGFAAISADPRLLHSASRKAPYMAPTTVEILVDSPDYVFIMGILIMRA